MTAIVKVFGAAVPIAALSLDALGERVVLVAAVIGALSFIWAKVFVPIIRATKAVIGGYHLLTEHLPGLVAHVESIDDRVEALEDVGKVVELARDEHVIAAKAALIRAQHAEPPQ